MATQKAPNAGSNRRSYTEDEWSAIKPRFIELYRNEGKTLKETMRQLQRQGFLATEKMYKRQIKKWGLEKYNKDKELLHLIAKHEQDRQKGIARAYTINGRVITIEDAKRHFKRKKVNSLDSLISELPSSPTSNINLVPIETKDLEARFDDDMEYDPMFADSNTTFSPDDETIPDPFASMDISLDEAGVPTEDIPHDLLSPFFEQMGLPDDPSQFLDRPTTYAADGTVVPILRDHPQLHLPTWSFLQNVTSFTNFIVDPYNKTHFKRFNRLWDLHNTTNALFKEGKKEQAIQTYSRAQSIFESMLGIRDPALLLSLCLILNEYLSNMEGPTPSSTFLFDMARWSGKHHPIARLVQDLSNSNDKSMWLLENTIREISEQLNRSIGKLHDLSLEVARLHARVLTKLGKYSTAEALLFIDLAEVETKFGVDSLQNMLRLSSLALCRFMAGENEGALLLYDRVLYIWGLPKINNHGLGDVKYGALYNKARSHRNLYDINAALNAANKALAFAMENYDSDHYFNSNARNLIRELMIGDRFEVISE